MKFIQVSGVHLRSFPEYESDMRGKVYHPAGVLRSGWYALSDRQGSKFQGAVFNVGGMLDMRE